MDPRYKPVKIEYKVKFLPGTFKSSEGPVKPIQLAKVAHLFLNAMSKLFHFMIYAYLDSSRADKSL